MRRICEQEEALFSEWKSRLLDEEEKKCFVADGVANEDSYLEISPKILFVLKEANGKKGEIFPSDFWRELLTKAQRGQTWQNIARWAYGIRHLPADIPWSGSLASADDFFRGEILKSIAAINVKKIYGSHTADGKKLKVAVKRDGDLLRKQIAIYEADFIICCGTRWLLEEAGFPSSKAKWQQTARGVEYCEYEIGKFIVDYHHPEARCRDYVLYYSLVDAVREMRFKETTVA
ncbi:MAG: hypothetical protein ACK4PK_03980 [Alphaproteobacteria bacterium]